MPSILSVMESQRRFVMLDPATDDVLSLCSGWADDGRCRLADAPPYLCEGLRLVGVGGASHRRSSRTVGETVPGRCPLASMDEE
jgi:hypothetical protein